MSYQDLRDHDGHLLARLDTKRWILEIQRRGVKTLFDLRQLLAPESAKENGMSGQGMVTQDGAFQIAAALQAGVREVNKLMTLAVASHDLRVDVEIAYAQQAECWESMPRLSVRVYKPIR